jgi:hypothetical protein
MSDPKNYLRKMIDATIAGDSENAEKAFKDYLVPKTMEVLGVNQDTATQEPAPDTEVQDSGAEAEPAPEETETE